MPAVGGTSQIPDAKTLGPYPKPKPRSVYTSPTNPTLRFENRHLHGTGAMSREVSNAHEEEALRFKIVRCRYQRAPGNKSVGFRGLGRARGYGFGIGGVEARGMNMVLTGKFLS